MVSWQSIRFRLSVQYSAVVFGLGAALLGLVYLALQRWLRSQTMTTHIVTGQRVFLTDGRLVIMPKLEEIEMRAIESVYNEVVLNHVAQFTIIALVALFLLSMIVGWVMSGRVLKPVEEITSVAREIQASDLSQRIDLDGSKFYLQPGAYVANGPGVKMSVGWAGIVSWLMGEGMFRLKVAGTGSVWFVEVICESG